MIFKEDYIYAGKILKTHGYQGEMVVVLDDDTKRILKKKEAIFIEIDGICVPFFIAAIQQQPNRLILKLDHIDHDVDAEEYIGLKIFVKDSQAKKKAKPFTLEEMIGFNFTDVVSEKKGIVVDIVDIPENPLLKIECNGNEYLVPFHNSLVEKMNIKENLLVMKLPEGLLD